MSSSAIRRSVAFVQLDENNSGGLTIGTTKSEEDATFSETI